MKILEDTDRPSGKLSHSILECHQKHVSQESWKKNQSELHRARYNPKRIIVGSVCSTSFSMVTIGVVCSYSYDDTTEFPCTLTIRSHDGKSCFTLLIAANCESDASITFRILCMISPVNIFAESPTSK